MALAALILLLAAWIALVEGGGWQRRIAMRVSGPGPWRRRAWWLIRAWLLFGATGLIAALMLSGPAALDEPPEAFAPVRAAVFHRLGGPKDLRLLFGSLMLGLAMGALILAGVEAIRRLRGKAPAPWRAAVEARTHDEIPVMLALAVTAGVTEELFFRLALPLAIAVVAHDAWLGQAVSLILFAVLHRYQGWSGVALTALSAALFSAVYLGTGSIFQAMALHVLIDINAMILRPLFGGRLKLSSSTDSRF